MVCDTSHGLLYYYCIIVVYNYTKHIIILTHSGSPLLTFNESCPELFINSEIIFNLL